LPSAATTTARSPARARWIALGAAGIACAAAAIAIASLRGGGSAGVAPSPSPSPSPSIDARPPGAKPAPAPAPHALTIVVGAMGGAQTQRAAILALEKAVPEALSVRDGDPAAASLDPARSFWVDAADFDVHTSGAQVECSLRVMIATYPDLAIFASIAGSARVDASATASDLDQARADCPPAVVEDLIATRIAPALRERTREPSAPSARDGDRTKAVIQHELARFTACYQARLGDLPTLAGKVETTFVIGGGGQVVNAHATGLDPQVASCVEHVLLTLRFPAPADGGTLMINYPFVFATR
jgi:hypothetical protein